MKILYGLHKQTDKLIGIDQAENGLSCNCICPSCKMDLVARQGEITEHHFAHYSKGAEETCEYSYWVSVRAMSKQLLQENNFLSRKEIQKFLLDQNIESPLLSLTPSSIEDFIFDGKIEGNSKVVYIYFLTEEEDRRSIEDQTLSHLSSLGNIFVYQIDLRDVNKYQNSKSIKYLRSIFSSQRGPGEWFSIKELIYDKEEEKKEKIKEENWFRKEVEKKALRRSEEWRKKQNEERASREKHKEIAKLPSDEKHMRRMIGFHEKMYGYMYDDKRTEELSVVYKGRNLWLISCHRKFFTVSFMGTHIVYTVEDGRIIPLADSLDFNNIPDAVVSLI